MTDPLEQPNAGSNLSSEKEEKLSGFYKIAEKFGVDPGIQDAIAYLNALGFNTNESCEGHIDHGSLATRVGVEALGKPTWRFVGQKEIFEKVALEHGVTLTEVSEHAKPKYGIPEEDMVYPENWEELYAVENEGWALTSREEETEEFKQWRSKTDELAEHLGELMREFYRERSAGEDIKLVVERHDDPELPHQYSFFLHNGGKNYLEMADPDEREKLSEEERNTLKARLEANQKEMKDFTEFLKKKYRTV